MSTYFLAAQDLGHAGDLPDSKLAASGAAGALAAGAAGTVDVPAARVAVARAWPRVAPRPPPRRSLTLADLRLRLRSVEGSAAELLSRGFEATGGGVRGSADVGNGGGGWEELSPLANSASFIKHEAAAYAVAGKEIVSVAGGSLSGIGIDTGGSHAGTSSQRRMLTVSVAPASGIGPPRRPSVAAPPSPGAGYSE